MASIIGTGGNDSINGTANDDDIDGGAGNDTINGGNGRDQIYGNLGDDSINGGAGADALSGGAGTDTINGGGATGGEQDQVNYWYEQNGLGQAVSVNLLLGTASDTYGDTDTLIGITEATGTYGNDTFIGGAGYNGFRGLAGNDTFINNAANGGHVWLYYSEDVFHGGTLGTIINLSNSAVTVTEPGFANITIGANTARDGFGDFDTLVDIHNIRGTATDDWILGSADQDHFQMNAGNDYIDGGGGFDRVDYSHDVDEGAPNRGVIVNLSSTSLTDINIGFGPTNVAAGTAVDGFGDVDRIFNVEQADGTFFDDYLVGSDGENRLVGYSGNDVLLGRNGNNNYDAGSGNDTIIGGDDEDWMVGGAGNDTFDGGGGWNNIVYIEEQNGAGLGVTFNWVDGTSTDSFGNNDTFTNIDSVHGTNSVDTFIGNGDENTFHGYGGNDVINGAGGIDAVHYHGEADYGGNQGVTVVLDNGTGAGGQILGHAIDGFGNRDALSSIENAEGTRFNDSLTGSALDNFLGGLEGHDTLAGGAGNDGHDGGDGNDTFIDSGATFASQPTGPGNGYGHLKDKGNGHDKNEDKPGHAKHHGIATTIEDNDWYRGGAGNDRFVFKEENGHDGIDDFDAGDSLTDVIDISAWNVSFSQVMTMAHNTDDGQGLVIQLDENSSIYLNGVYLDVLRANDFIV